MATNPHPSATPADDLLDQLAAVDPAAYGQLAAVAAAALAGDPIPCGDASCDTVLDDRASWAAHMASHLPGLGSSVTQPALTEAQHAHMVDAHGRAIRLHELALECAADHRALGAALWGSAPWSELGDIEAEAGLWLERRRQTGWGTLERILEATSAVIGDDLASTLTSPDLPAHADLVAEVREYAVRGVR